MEYEILNHSSVKHERKLVKGNHKIFPGLVFRKLLARARAREVTRGDAGGSLH